MLWCLWPHADRGGGGEIAPGATAFRARGSLRCLASGEDFAVRGGAGKEPRGTVVRSVPPLLTSDRE